MGNAFAGDYKTKYLTRLHTDIPFYARWCLKIRTKSGSIEPFVFNKAQQYTHDEIEKQLMDTGRVRVLVLKGRQQGMSTYIAGRFYHKTTHLSGKATFILSHEASTTEKLFGIVERYHKNVPDPVKMDTDVNNRRRMLFAGLGSEYFVGTAGNEEVGRGGTVQYLHASECAFYPASSGFSKGLLQSVPDAPGTEVFMESTANGMDALFYPLCMQALQGKSDFKLIFIPWFWQTEYHRQTPSDFKATPEELKLAQLYNLDNAQLYWRRLKIIELKGEIGFMQEYPCSVEEAFTVSGESLIPAIAVMQARKSSIEDASSPLVIGVDSNDAGGPIGIVWRRGRKILKYRIIENRKAMEAAGILAEIINTDMPAKMFMDTGNGYGVLDRLHELGYDKVAIGVGFGEGATEDSLYLNKRAEMGCALAQWFINGAVRIPDDDLLQRHLCSVPARRKTSSDKTKLEIKEIIIKETGIDPHLFDAAALTFAYPVRAEGMFNSSNRIKKISKQKSSLKSIRRRDEYQRGNIENPVASATLVL